MGKKYFIVDAKCSSTKKAMGIQFEDCGDMYYAVGCVSASGGTGGSSETHTGKFLNGGTYRCKHCGTSLFVRCGGCGAFMCVSENADEVTCPDCGVTLKLIKVTADEMSVTSADSKNQ